MLVSHDCFFGGMIKFGVVGKFNMESTVLTYFAFLSWPL